MAARRVDDLNEGSMNLGLVTFSTAATTEQEISLLTSATKNDTLRAIERLSVLDYTCIGCGLLEALSALKRANISTKGATVMLMTDGKENEYPYIKDVLGNLTLAGVVVNTLAVGPSAENGLEKLALDTRGEAFLVKDPDGTYFGDVDAVFVESTTAQLDESEKPVAIVNLKTSFNGSIEIHFNLDEELGNDTVVYIVYDRNHSEAINASLIDPAGDLCTSCIARSSKVTGETKIRISSPAMPGVWTAVLSGPESQLVRASVRVESRSRDSSVEPVRVKCTVQPLVPSPAEATIYAHVTKGVAVVLAAEVHAEVLTPTRPHAVELKLYDDGLGVDNAANDGIYSGAFVNFTGRGRYAVSARVTSSERTRLEYKSQNPSSLPASGSQGYKVSSTEPAARGYGGSSPNNGNVRSRRSPSAVMVERYAVGGSFQVTAELSDRSVPPGNIRDLRVIQSSSIGNGTLRVRLTWTWPGGHLDVGKVQSVQLRASANYESLINAFEDQHLGEDADVLHGDLLPRASRTAHVVDIALPAYVVGGHGGKKEDIRKAYLSAVVTNEFGLKSEMSNIVFVTSASYASKQLPGGPVTAQWLFVTALVNKVLLGLAISGFAAALVSFTALGIWCTGKRGRWIPERQNNGCEQKI